MLVIQKTPVYITRELCYEAGKEYNDSVLGAAALGEDRQICAFALFEIKDKTVVITYTKSEKSDVLDGVVRVAIAIGESAGCEYYDFDVDKSCEKSLLPIGFRKSETGGHSIKKLFTVCSGCGKGDKNNG